ncbi:MAG: DNA integrity scanning protein DisA nucleotide-binding domain protein, partial [Selenomonadaceae bacterium]|nr:DNA integrity scanning protein DisA nucleotide-binding domain protein [Selenomonadaceae bacterium]
LLNVFIVNTPLHDGAAIIRGNRLISAACVLPLTENHELSTELGTRHRAAIGLSEQCDALVVVVSEETGTISVAEGGRLMRRFDEKTLAAKIRPAFEQKENKIFGKFFSRWRDEK